MKEGQTSALVGDARRHGGDSVADGLGLLSEAPDFLAAQLISILAVFLAVSVGGAFLSWKDKELDTQCLCRLNIRTTS